jgi:hypothetical protein
LEEDSMNSSGSRAADDINLDEFERRLRAAGAHHSNAEDPLSELARLVESSRSGFSSGAPSEQPVTRPADVQPSPSVEIGELRPTIDAADDLVPAASEADREARQDYEFDAYPSAAEQAAEKRPRGWTLTVSALALAGVAMIGGVFALKGRVPGLPTQPPFIAAAQGPTKVQPPSDETVATSNDAGASLLKDNAKPAAVKVVSSEEQPVDLTAQGSLGNPPSAEQPNAPVGAKDATPLAATVNTPLVPPPAAPPPIMSSQFPEPKPVRTVSLRPDGTPIAAPNVPDQAGGDAAPAAAEPNPPAKPAPKPATDATGVAQPSSPKLELPTRLSPKSSARVVVAKTDTTALDATAQTPSEPSQPAAAIKQQDKATKKPKPAPAVADATAPAPAAPATPAAPTTPPVDSAATSGGWAVQLAAPKSEGEAKSEIARLTSKYATELNGSPIAVHKAVVNGETIYRLRVVGFTKADAAALCARLKGGGGECFIAK